jgi:hypothetical protein
LRAACRSPAMTCVCIWCVVVTEGQGDRGERHQRNQQRGREHAVGLTVKAGCSQRASLHGRLSGNATAGRQNRNPGAPCVRVRLPGWRQWRGSA